MWDGRLNADLNRYIRLSFHYAVTFSSAINVGLDKPFTSLLSLFCAKEAVLMDCFQFRLATQQYSPKSKVLF